MTNLGKIIAGILCIIFVLSIGFNVKEHGRKKDLERTSEIESMRLAVERDTTRNLVKGIFAEVKAKGGIQLYEKDTNNDGVVDDKDGQPITLTLVPYTPVAP